MKRSAHAKLRGRTGASVLLLLLAAAVLVLAVMILVPLVAAGLDRTARVGCQESLANAERDLRLELASTGLTPEKDRAEAILEASGAACPAGGELWLEREDEDWVVCCGLHDENTARRALHNAAAVKERLEERVFLDRTAGRADPAHITVTLNHRDLTAEITGEPVTTHRGTDAITGKEGTVAVYSLDDRGVCYLAYLDEARCIEWDRVHDWKVW